jgi:hypothetical protein
VSESFEFEALRDTRASRSALAKASFSPIHYEQLDPEKWRLAKGRHLENLLNIESTGVALGNMADIKVGFATLKDAVFFAEEQNGICIAAGTRGEPQEIELEATRPAVKIADLETESDLDQNTRRIIFPYKKRNGKLSIIEENKFAKSFPRAYRYLKSYRETLASRDKGRKRYEAWYAWGRTQGREAEGPKLLTKTFNSEPCFFLDESDQLFCNGYSIALNPVSLFGTQIPIEALQRILNSSLMHYYAKLTSFQIEGNYQCYQKNFIERFGILNLSHKQIETLMELNREDLNEYLCRLYGIRLTDVQSVVS